jgi:hypothetical protein
MSGFAIFLIALGLCVFFYAQAKAAQQQQVEDAEPPRNDSKEAT